jgi:hypothetical protein
VVAAGRALIATHGFPAGAAAVHAGAAALAVDELAQQVLLGGTTGLDDAGAPRADFLHAVEQLVADDRCVGSPLIARLLSRSPETYPELNDLDDEQTMALTVSETCEVRRKRAAVRRRSAMGEAEPWRPSARWSPS